MKNLKLVLLSAMACALLNGCAVTNSSAVQQSEIYTVYEVSYRYGDSSHATTTPILNVEATFYVTSPSGNYVNLDGGSEILVGGSALTERNETFGGVVYERKKTDPTDSDLNQAFDFAYTNNDGKTFKNTLSLPPAVSITNAAGTSYPLNGDLHVGWTTPSAVAGHESIQAVLQKADGTSYTTRTVSASGIAGEVILTQSDLSYAKAGAALLSICRAQTGGPAQATEVGGRTRTERCTAKVAITLY